ncbi:hypothetical protein B0I08_105158 [Glaciihabitans tibetensis]|uniref:Uncharacterized protein n=2 Tax=Glaciihabitans tibetensis TaxID=1266600 RepID=A0A2T0VCX9_9MICO|nr:hypothetical protein B0I08_105158 [Glaciihabitans tibetensis]
MGGDLRLLAVLAEQRTDLSSALWRLERAAHLVPTVDTAQWQGPARGAYDLALARLRSSLTAAINELTAARNATHTAERTLLR